MPFFTLSEAPKSATEALKRGFSRYVAGFSGAKKITVNLPTAYTGKEPDICLLRPFVAI